MLLAVLAQVAAIGIDDRGRVVEHPAHRQLVERRHDDHLVLPGTGLHQLGGRTGDRLGSGVPAFVLAGAEVGAVEDLLEAEDLHALLRRLVDEREVLVEHRLLDPGDRLRLVIEGVAALDQPTPDDVRHRISVHEDAGLMDRSSGLAARTPRNRGRGSAGASQRPDRGPGVSRHCVRECNVEMDRSELGSSLRDSISERRTRGGASQPSERVRQRPRPDPRPAFTRGGREGSPRFARDGGLSRRRIRDHAPGTNCPFADAGGRSRW